CRSSSMYGLCVVRRVGSARRSLPRILHPSPARQLDADGGDEKVDDEQRHEGEDDRLIDCVADTLGAAFDVQSEIGGYETGNHAEQPCLDLGDHELPESGEEGDAVDERAGVDVL